MAEAQVFVRFVPAQGRVPVPAALLVADDRLAVPTALKRLGLSQVVNHLLGRSEQPVPFEFIINERFLRTSLGAHLQQHGLNQEATITIEYVPALGVPDAKRTVPHLAWLTALDAHQSSHDVGVLSGGSDGVVRVWDVRAVDSEAHAHGKKRPRDDSATLEGAKSAITALASCTMAPPNATTQHSLTVLAAAEDEKLRAYALDANRSATALCTLVGHEGGVSACDIHPGGDVLVSGGADSSVKVWKLSESGVEEPRNKRRKTTSTVHNALRSLQEHTDMVSVVRCIGLEELLTASWDHSLRFWDLESGLVTLTLNGADAVHSASEGGGVVVTTHADGAVRAWDRRMQRSEISTAYESHTRWATSVAFHPTRPELFASGSHDATVKLWDLRSRTPLATLSAHEAQVLAVTWLNEHVLLSGGADEVLRTHAI